MKPNNVFRALVLGDVIGDPGRQAIFRTLHKIRQRLEPDMVIINGENAAHGFGITRNIVEEFLQNGISVVTTGNHVWQKKEIFKFIDEFPGFLRPLNYPPGTPGHGSVILDIQGVKVGVINAMGRIYMDAIDCPFQAVDKVLEEFKSQGVNIIFIDFHADASSEKQVMGRYCDGRVSAVWGTHTHTQTADERILPGKTAYIGDIGMCGCTESIIGMRIEDSIRRVVHHLPVRFSPADNGPIEVQGIVVDVDRETGRAMMISRVREEGGSVQPTAGG